jgi:Uma2 family endonuclease
MTVEDCLMAAEPTTATLLAPDDLLEMPEDGNRFELLRGELMSTPMSSCESNDIAIGIGSVQRAFAHPRGSGRVADATGAFILACDPSTVRIADESFVRSDRLPPAEQRRKFLELAPDLAVEVVSPSDTASDVHEKVIEYLVAGVRRIWVVHSM